MNEQGSSKEKEQKGNAGRGLSTKHAEYQARMRRQDLNEFGGVEFRALALRGEGLKELKCYGY